MSEAAKWYVIHTYSGYENKVAQNIEKVVENRKLHELIQEVRVPTEKATEITDGKTKEVERKTYPGYVLVKMIMNDDSWYVVRNTPGVTGFVGTTTKPIPLSDEEAERIINGGNAKKPAAVTVKAGDRIRITKGVFEDRTATVLEVADDKTKIKADISNFGTTTTIELEAGSFEPLP